MSRLTETVSSLENVLAREHAINDVLLSERRLRDELSSPPVVNTSSPPRQPHDQNNVDSPISQPITPAQRGRASISLTAEDNDNLNLFSPTIMDAQGGRPDNNSRSEEEVITNNASNGSERHELADLHEADIARSKKLSVLLPQQLQKSSS